MKYYKEGDKSKAICDWCKKIVDTTMIIYELGYDTLVAKCDECSNVVAIPEQSWGDS